MPDPLSGEARGARLCLAMKARGVMKLCVLSAAMGVSESAVSRWRHGGPITLHNAAQLCGALDISLDWLMLGRGHLNAPAPQPRQVECHSCSRLPAHLRDKLAALVTAILDAS